MEKLLKVSQQNRHKSLLIPRSYFGIWSTRILCAAFNKVTVMGLITKLSVLTNEKESPGSTGWDGVFAQKKVSVQSRSGFGGLGIFLFGWFGFWFKMERQ